MLPKIVQFAAIAQRHPDGRNKPGNPVEPIYQSQTVCCPALLLNRTRFLGHSVGLRGHGHGRKLVLAASCVWAEVAVFLDQPLGVVAGDEGSDGVAEVFEGLEDAAVDDLLLDPTWRLSEKNACCSNAIGRVCRLFARHVRLA
ncbi:hypothetical protein KO353_12705 [Elioraea tepida]|uniref:Uncharacterized protein n=1 Tax=Elioraea tepida TaxID=2843330 RepID=A0A975U0L5_9PROT|nr:hypothetical protein [Elioraea tepida]QXM24125.1 hypothetical protein KO353_12705 [Elioraea tepida]